MPVLHFSLRLTFILVAVTALVTTVGCGARGTLPDEEIRDGFGTPIAFDPPATRIVSLNPATTELFFALGAGARLVGRTHWDSYPDSARLVPDLGNGLQPNVESVLGARPDLVLLYASEDNRDAARVLGEAGIRVVSLRIDRIAQFDAATRILGRLIGDTIRSRIVGDSVATSLDRVKAATANLPRPTVFWHVWDAPLLTIGSGSYMNELVEIAGGRNVYADLTAPSPQVSFEDLVRRAPEVVLAGPVGAATIRKDPSWTALSAVRDGRVLVVDTALVGRPSVRLGEAARAIAALLHPGAVR